MITTLSEGRGCGEGGVRGFFFVQNQPIPHPSCMRDPPSPQAGEGFLSTDVPGEAKKYKLPGYGLKPRRTGLPVVPDRAAGILLTLFTPPRYSFMYGTRIEVLSEACNGANSPVSLLRVLLPRSLGPGPGDCEGRVGLLSSPDHSPGVFSSCQAEGIA